MVAHTRSIRRRRAISRAAAALPVALAAIALSPALMARADDEEKSERTVVKLGSLAPEGTPWAELLQRLKKHIEVASKGSVRVKLYLNGRQGDESDMLGKMGDGKLQGGGFTSSGLADTIPSLTVLELPFIFEDDAEADHVMDTVVRAEMAKRFEEKGLYLYCWAVNGWVDFGSTKRPVRSLGDIKASKPYARPSIARKAFWEACGIEPATIPVPEVAAALKEGKADLYMTTPLFSAASQWWSSTKHWTDSNHVYQPAALVFDLKWWNEQPEAFRNELAGFADDLQAEARKKVRGLDVNLMEMFRKRGIDVHTLSAPERAAMKKATASVAKTLMADGAFDEALLARVEKALAARREDATPKRSETEVQLEIADKAYEARGKDALPELTRGRDALAEILRREPNNFDALWRMCRIHYYLGYYGPEGQALDTYNTGVDWGKKAVAANSSRVEGHLWLAWLWGIYGQTRGITSSLFLVDDIEQALERAIAIDPAYFGGSPERIYGRLYFKLPWIAGGDNDKAIEHLRNALRHDDSNPFNYVYLAEVLIDEDEEEEAEKLLRTFMRKSMDPPKQWKVEYDELDPDARRLLGQID